nr:MAG TPA: hypothetical protein [Bacteriophage sp.]
MILRSLVLQKFRKLYVTIKDLLNLYLIDIILNYLMYRQ